MRRRNNDKCGEIERPAAVRSPWQEKGFRCDGEISTSGKKANDLQSLGDFDAQQSIRCGEEIMINMERSNALRRFGDRGTEGRLPKRERKQRVSCEIGQMQQWFSRRILDMRTAECGFFSDPGGILVNKL